MDWQAHARRIFHQRYTGDEDPYTMNNVDVVQDDILFILPSEVYLDVTRARDFDFGDAPHVECQLRFAQARDYLRMI